jgi:hypothetical protein
MNCLGKANNLTSIGTKIIECRKVSFALKSFELVNFEDPVLNIKMCLDQECGNYQTLKFNFC